jgi:hypothetical protein
VPELEVALKYLSVKTEGNAIWSVSPAITENDRGVSLVS